MADALAIEEGIEYPELVRALTDTLVNINEQHRIRLELRKAERKTE
jgi:hypothetical protein